MPMVPVRSRTFPVAFAFTAALAFALTGFAPVARAWNSSPGHKGREVNVYGRKLYMPTPIGMQELPVEPDMRGVPYARFAPESQTQRPTLTSFESLPFTAKANAEAEMNKDAATAANAIALLRAQPLPAADSQEAEDLKLALKSGLAGGRDVLMTRVPEGVTLLERIESTPDGVIDLTAIGQRGDFTLVGSALLLVGGRAVWLRVIRRNPETESDLVGVREAIIHWVEDARESNRPANAK